MECIFEYDGIDVKFKPINISNNSSNNIELEVSNDNYIINQLREIHLSMVDNINNGKLKYNIESKFRIYNGNYIVCYNAIIESMSLNFDQYSNNRVNLNIIYDYSEVVSDYNIIQRKEKIEKLLNNIKYEKV